MNPLLLATGYLLCAIALGAWVLHLRDKSAARRGETAVQTQARFASLLQLRNTMYRAAPGLLLMTFGAFYAVVGRFDDHPDWWYGLGFILLGWFLVPLLARGSWRRYLELRRIANGETAPIEYS